MHATKKLLIDLGLKMLLEQGYNSLGLQSLLDAARVPKGSFYHHFADKEDFALQVIDAYIAGVHETLDACVANQGLAPLDRIRAFFQQVEESYRSEGYLGCLMGGLGQELSGVNDAFRARIDWCLSSIADRLRLCLDAARAEGAIPQGSDTALMANLLVDCWEGAALRSRLRRSPIPLVAMLTFYLDSVCSLSEVGAKRPPEARRARRRSSG
jgi:TetR/AcrR family transcriptional regulator, transcriptional repressor for nem operon